MLKKVDYSLYSFDYKFNNPIKNKKGDFMLKGINRRIIEISKTDNEFFEKAILFVRPDKFDYSHQKLSAQAESYLNSISRKNTTVNFPKKSVFSITVSVLLIILGALIALFFMQI